MGKTMWKKKPLDEHKHAHTHTNAYSQRTCERQTNFSRLVVSLKRPNVAEWYTQVAFLIFLATRCICAKHKNKRLEGKFSRKFHFAPAKCIGQFRRSSYSKTIYANPNISIYTAAIWGYSVEYYMYRKCAFICVSYASCSLHAYSAILLQLECHLKSVFWISLNFSFYLCFNLTQHWCTLLCMGTRVRVCLLARSPCRCYLLLIAFPFIPNFKCHHTLSTSFVCDVSIFYVLAVKTECYFASN